MLLRFDSMIYLSLMILGIVVAIAPWTFAPVCVSEMRCWFTRDVETVLGAVITLLAVVGLYRSLA